MVCMIVPLALLTGFALPPALGLLWHDPIGAFVYGGLVARLLSTYPRYDSARNATDVRQLGTAHFW